MNYIRNFLFKHRNSSVVSQPPVSQPPVSQPPVSQPPVSQPPVPQLNIAIPLLEVEDTDYAEDVYVFGSIDNCNYSPSIEIRHGKYSLSDTIVPLVDQLKYTIMSSHFRHSKEIIGLNLLTKVELTLALDYLDDINRKTPKNKTRPKIRSLIIEKLNA